MIRRAIALLFVLLTSAACSSAPAGEDDADRLLAVVVHSMGVAGTSANFEVSLANVSSQTLKITSVTVNPGVPREMAGVPVTREFTLEPGMEQSVMAEMRLYPGTTTGPLWPDQVAVDVSFERNGKREGRTYHVDVLGIRQR